MTIPITSDLILFSKKPHRGRVSLFARSIGETIEIYTYVKAVGYQAMTSALGALGFGVDIRGRYGNGGGR